MKENKSFLPKTSLKQKIALLIFGVSLYLVLLELGLRLGGFVISSLQEHRNTLSIKQKGAYRIMCLGESTTQGQYPHFLEEVLNRSNIGVKFSVIDKGVVATNTMVILSRLESDLEEYHPDMVITMMGINDKRSPISFPYETVSDSKAINFIQSFRIYKLTRLLWLHILSREATNTSSHKASLKLKKTIELVPRNDMAYVELGKSYRTEGMFAEAEAAFKKAIELNPRNDMAYIELGTFFYQVQGKFSEAEVSFKKAIELAPGNDRAYIELGVFYREEGKFPEAGASFKEAIEFNPRNDMAYVELGTTYRLDGKPPEAEAAFKKAIELNPRNDMAYVELGTFYRYEGKSPEAEAAFKKAIELNPRNDMAYAALGWYYRSQGKFSEAEAAFKKAIELNPRNDRECGALEVLNMGIGNMELARHYRKEIKNLRLNYYSPATTSSYLKLKTILDKKNIKYVCMQYPMRNLDPLKEIFQGNDKGIIFIDNEKIFKDALRQRSYKDYFRDMFGGDFGHCTDKGNKLLAENIAKVILKEVFNK